MFSFKALELTKSTKIILSPITGLYGRFQKQLKFVNKVWKSGFLCYVLEYVHGVHPQK